MVPERKKKYKKMQKMSRLFNGDNFPFSPFSAERELCTRQRGDGDGDKWQPPPGPGGRVSTGEILEQSV